MSVWGSGVRDLFILNLDTWWKRAVNFTSQSL